MDCDRGATPCFTPALFGVMRRRANRLEEVGIKRTPFGALPR
jgi:hypothetical protein